MARGGYRPGAGRKPSKGKQVKKSGSDDPGQPNASGDTIQIILASDINNLAPLDFLLGVMRNDGNSPSMRLKAAEVALPFTAPRPAPAAKKDERAEAAKAAASKFTTAPPPRHLRAVP